LGFTNPSEVIYDPFVGSGTTFESCIKNGRYCIGFEIKPEYCEFAKRRIEGLQTYQLTLDFAQESLLYEPV